MTHTVNQTNDSNNKGVDIRVIDSHCHLNYEGLGHMVDDVIKRAHDAGVSKMISVCTHLDEAEEIYDIAKRHICVHATIGVHPHDAEKELEKHGGDIEKIRQKLEEYAERPRVVAIGETGLDYYYEHSPKDKQKEIFELQIETAIKYDLPLIIHTREAEKDTIDILEKYKGKARGVIHCFTGSKWLADQALALGFYISVPGIITFNSAKDIRETIKTVPLDKLLIETDAPFLAPIPHRGKTNEPAYVIETLKYLADMLDIPLNDLANITRKNTLQLFNKIL